MSSLEAKRVEQLMDILWKSGQRKEVSFGKLAHELKVTKGVLEDLMTLAAIRFPKVYHGLFPVTPGDGMVYVTNDPDMIVADIAPRLITGNTKYARARAGASVIIDSLTGRNEYTDLIAFVINKHNELRSSESMIKSSERNSHRNIRQKIKFE